MSIRRIHSVPILLLFAILLGSSLPAVLASEPDPVLIEMAETFVDQLSRGEFEQAAEPFDATMRGAAPPEKLGEIWRNLLGSTGPFQAREGVRHEIAGQYWLIFVGCRFENRTLDIKVVFDGASRIAGMFFLESRQDYEAPDYVKAGTFTEEDVIIGEAPWALPGTLTLPWEGDKFPAVLLVHGSGPNDRDETIGPNKPFKDLAWGLASRGIAVLRYDKRTRAYSQRMASLSETVTVKEEVIDDALAGIKFLQGQKSIDPKRVSLLGHSLGGYLAPRIAARDKSIAGLILLAAPARPMEKLILEQVTYIANLDGEISAEEDSMLAETARQVKRVEGYSLTSDVASELLPLGIPAAYWLDLRYYDPVEEAAALEMPMLVIQGGRDYQVRESDFALWRKAFSKDMRLRPLYLPKLNHLLMTGEGESAPAEYNLVGHVDQRVLSAVAGWVNANVRSGPR